MKMTSLSKSELAKCGPGFGVGVAGTTQTIWPSCLELVVEMLMSVTVSHQGSLRWCAPCSGSLVVSTESSREVTGNSVGKSRMPPLYGLDAGMVDTRCDV